MKNFRAFSPFHTTRTIILRVKHGAIVSFSLTKLIIYCSHSFPLLPSIFGLTFLSCATAHLVYGSQFKKQPNPEENTVAASSCAPVIDVWRDIILMHHFLHDWHLTGAPPQTRVNANHTERVYSFSNACLEITTTCWASRTRKGTLLALKNLLFFLFFMLISKLGFLQS